MIQELINQEVKDFERQTLECNPSYAKTQEDILKLIDLYWVDKFRDGDTNELGDKKAFYNIVENPTLVASKMIDIDTKDIRLIAEDDQSYYPAWLLGKELHFWMKNTKNEEGLTFGQFLNQSALLYPKYGHLLVKKVGNTVVNVPLLSVINKQDAESILKSPYVIEKHVYTPQEFKKIGTEKKWNNVKKIYNALKDTGEIVVYERLGDVEGTDDNYFIVVDGMDESEGILLQTKIKPQELYKELKWDNIVGRALGRGQVEKLFEAQIQMNKVANFKSEGLEWTSKHLFQTRDDGVNRNLMNNTKNGDVLIVNSGVEPVSMEERNLSAYMEEESRWDKLIDRRTFSYDAVRGERAPAGTPLGSSILQAQMAGGFFDLKREDFGMFIKDIIVDWILPSFQKQVRNTHTIFLGEFTEGELSNIRNVLSSYYTNEAIINFIIKNKRIPDDKEAQLLRGIVSDKITLKKTLDVPEGYYKDITYKVLIDITGESIDTVTKTQSLLYLVSLLSANPNIMQDPRIKEIVLEVMNYAGISPKRMIETPKLEETLQQVMPKEAMPVAGSAPTMPNVSQPQIGKANVQL